MSTCSASLFFFSRSGDHQDLHSFPTRRSSDLGIEAARVGARVEAISAAVQTATEEAGFSVVRNLVGHGVGRFYHEEPQVDRKSTRLNSSHLGISYAVFCLKKKKKEI